MATVKIETFRGNAAALHNYLCKLEKQLDRVRYHNFARGVDPVAVIRGVLKATPRNARAASIVTISLGAGEYLIPRHWETLRQEVLDRLSQVASTRGPDKKRDPVNCRELLMVCPVHDNTAHQHAQWLILWWHPDRQRVVVINQSWDWPAWHWAVREVEPLLELGTHPHHPKPRLEEKDGVKTVVMPKKEKKTQFSPEQAVIETHRGVPSVARRVRALLQGLTPGVSTDPRRSTIIRSWQEFAAVLAPANGGLRRRSSGVNIYIDGEKCKLSSVAKNNPAFDIWRLENLSALWGKPDNWWELGIPLEKQIAAAATANSLEHRMPGVVKTIAARPHDYAEWLVHQALARLPAESWEWVCKGVKGQVGHRKQLAIEELPSGIMKLLELESQGYDVFITPRPLPGEVLIPFPPVNAETYDAVKRDYGIGYAVRNGELYFGLIRADSLGDPVADKIATRAFLRRLGQTYHWAEEMGPEAWLPMPGLYRTASTGTLTEYVRRSWARSARASEELAMVWQEEQKRIARLDAGAPAKMAEKLGRDTANPELVLYRETLLELAYRTSARCLAEDDANVRVAARLLLGGRSRAMALRILARWAPLATLKPITESINWNEYAEARVKAAETQIEDIQQVQDLTVFNRQILAKSGPSAPVADRGAIPGHTAVSTQPSPSAMAGPVYEDDRRVEQKRRKSRQEENRQRWLNLRKYELENDPADPVAAGTRRVEEHKWLSVPSQPRPAWIQAMEQEWANVQGTHEGTLTGLGDALERRRKSALALNLDRLDYVRLLCQGTSSEEAAARAIALQRWQIGEAPIPDFLLPLLAYKAKPRKGGTLPEESGGTYVNREFAEAATANDTKEANALWGAILRAVQLRGGILGPTAALVQQQYWAERVGLVSSELSQEGPVLG